MSSNIPCNTNLLVRKRKPKKQQQKTKYEENTLKKDFFL